MRPGLSPIIKETDVVINGGVMNVTAELDAMRSELSGCSLVAFTDLSSQLVLCASAASKPVQEELNALSEAANLALDGAFAEGAAPLWSEGGEAPAETAVLLTGAEVRVFLRSPGKPNEALVCVCAPDAELDTVVDSARSTLNRILAES